LSGDFFCLDRVFFYHFLSLPPIVLVQMLPQRRASAGFSLFLFHCQLGSTTDGSFFFCRPMFFFSVILRLSIPLPILLVFSVLSLTFPGGPALWFRPKFQQPRTYSSFEDRPFLLEFCLLALLLRVFFQLSVVEPPSLFYLRTRRTRWCLPSFSRLFLFLIRPTFFPSMRYLLFDDVNSSFVRAKQMASSYATRFFLSGWRRLYLLSWFLLPPSFRSSIEAWRCRSPSALFSRVFFDFPVFFPSRGKPFVSSRNSLVLFLSFLFPRDSFSVSRCSFFLPPGFVSRRVFFSTDF